MQPPVVLWVLWSVPAMGREGTQLLTQCGPRISESGGQGVPISLRVILSISHPLLLLELDVTSAGQTCALHLGRLGVCSAGAASTPTTARFI